MATFSMLNVYVLHRKVSTEQNNNNNKDQESDLLSKPTLQENTAYLPLYNNKPLSALILFKISQEGKGQFISDRVFFLKCPVDFVSSLESYFRQ